MVSCHAAPPMAQVRSVLSRRQLVEIPRRLSIHLLRSLHPVPGTRPLQPAAAGGIFSLYQFSAPSWDTFCLWDVAQKRNRLSSVLWSSGQV